MEKKSHHVVFYERATIHLFRAAANLRDLENARNPLCVFFIFNSRPFFPSRGQNKAKRPS